MKELPRSIEIEIASVKKTMERWNSGCAYSRDQNGQLKSEMENLRKEIAGLEQARRQKKQKRIARLNKNIDQLLKEDKIVSQTLKISAAT